ncbi:unnamed protein product [Linum trigynum]|uniref:Uncharacterized protein n=1 Tax=Linum trigynum TaxID=586398 RepID=A0AAV2FGS9_9ROSI
MLASSRNRYSLTICSLFPYLYFMVRDFNVATHEEDIGYYAGYVDIFIMRCQPRKIRWSQVLNDRCGGKFSLSKVSGFNNLLQRDISEWRCYCSSYQWIS